MQSDSAEILAVIRQREAAVAVGDADAVLRVQSEDSVTYDLPPPLEMRGTPPEAREGLNQWFATWHGGVSTRLVDPEMRIEGDLAVVYGLSRMMGRKVAGEEVDLWYRSTVVLRRDGHGWRIVHEHNSVPMAMDGSGKALTDLQPEA